MSHGCAVHMGQNPRVACLWPDYELVGPALGTVRKKSSALRAWAGAVRRCASTGQGFLIGDCCRLCVTTRSEPDLIERDS